jgi:hypothetical protein
MTNPPEQHFEPPPAAEAPAIIILPPLDPAPEPYQPRSGSEKRKRQHVKRCRFDDDELAEFERRARAHKLSDGAFIRASTLDTPGPRSKRNQPTPDTRLLAQNLTALNRLGNNLNQTTRALNELVLIAREMGADRLTRIAGDAIERNRTTLDELRNAVAANVRALGWDDRKG